MSPVYVIVIALALIQGAMCKQSGEEFDTTTVVVDENVTTTTTTTNVNTQNTTIQNDSLPTTDGEVVERVSYTLLQEDSTESTTTQVVTTPSGNTGNAVFASLVLPILLALIPASRFSAF